MSNENTVWRQPCKTGQKGPHDWRADPNCTSDEYCHAHDWQSEGVTIDNLKLECESLRIDKAHLIDDYEKIVTADLRMMLQYRSLLHDGMHALRNGRLDVAAEFMDRTITALTERSIAIQARS